MIVYGFDVVLRTMATHSTFSQRGELLEPHCPIHREPLKKCKYDWLFSCEICGLEASTLLPNISSGHLSGELSEGDRESGLNSIRIENGNRILDALARETTGRKLLDVGSGPGFFLTLATERLFDAVGLEPDHAIASICQASGQRVREGFFPEALSENEVFDLITLNDVLEHIPDLSKAFKGFNDHLYVGGLLLLNCPDRNGVIYRIAKLLDKMGFSPPFFRMWQLGLPSPHVWYFTRSELRVMAEERGFEFVRYVDLKTLSRTSLYDRVSYVKGQSKLFNVFAFAVMWLLVPLLRLLSSDLGAVIVRKK